METYLLKFSACLLVFWLVYVLFLEREKMHQIKRIYLLSTMILSIVIPLLTITYYVEPIVTDFEVSQTFIPIEPSYISIAEEAPSFWNLGKALWLIYVLGVLLFSSRFIVNLVKMYKRISVHTKVSERSFIYVLLQELRIPHSFFNYIFLNQSKYEAESIPKEVILHEETHAKQLHSLDIMAIELLQIIFWFHPLVYILKHHIKLNHEFLADEAVLQEGVDTKTYQNILLQFSSNTAEYQLSSAINYSSIKKRFTVMKTQTSKTRIWISTLLLLPIIAILFYSFAEKEYVEKETIAETSILNDKNRESNLFLVTVEKNRNSIELKCESGCKWSHLILEPNSEAYIINDYGFSKGETLETDKFTFSIKPSESGVDLNGLKGTNWIDLSLPLSKDKKQAINQLGMTNLFSAKNKENLKGKTLEIKAINNKLKINNIDYDINNYANVLNNLTKNWTSKDYKSIIPELEISSCSQDFLDKLDIEFRKSNYFLITIQGSKILSELETNSLKDYQKKYTKYEVLRNSKPHYIEKSGEAQKQMDVLFSDLGDMYFRMSKANKTKVKRPVAPISPYAKIELNSKTYYKKYEELTKEEKATLPLPPPPSPNNTKDELNVDAPQNSYNPTFLEYIIEMEKEGASFYLDGKKISAEKARSVAKTNKGKQTEMITQKDVNGKYVVKLSSPKAIEVQEKATAKQIAEYNTWAKRINNQDEGMRIIKKKDYDKYKRIYNLMSDTQRKNAELFPQLPPPPPPPPLKQGEVNDNQIKAYNKWVKNIKDPNGNHKMIKKEDYKYFMSIYNLMTDEQKKKTAGLPPPPPPPVKPTSLKDKSGPVEINGTTYYYSQKNGKTTYYDRYGKVVDINKIPPPPPVPVGATPAQKAKMEIATKAYKKALQHNNSEVNKLTGYTEINGEKLYYNSENGKTTYYNRYGKEVKMDNLPPPPPAPESTLDFVIRMAKAKAKFFNEGKSISSDKAIALIKKNNKLNINAKEKGANNEPLVYISKRPILIGINGKVGKSMKENYNRMNYAIINNRQVNGPEIALSINDFKNLKITLQNSTVNEFEIMFPDNKPMVIHGNTLNKKAKAKINSLKDGQVISIYDIKNTKNIVVSPVLIVIKSKN